MSKADEMREIIYSQCEEREEIIQKVYSLLLEKIKQTSVSGKRCLEYWNSACSSGDPLCTLGIRKNLSERANEKVIKMLKDDGFNVYRPRNDIESLFYIEW